MARPRNGRSEPRRRRGASPDEGRDSLVTTTPALRLGTLGISPGQRVRFRRGVGRRWCEGVATGVEKDGSLGVRDAKGAARAIPLDRIEVRTEGRRGSARWEPLLHVAARTEQLRLF